MVCRYRPDGTILFVNGSYARTLGTTPEALAGGNFWEFVPEEDRAAVRALLDQLTPEQTEIRIENRLATVDGVRWTLWTNRALAFDADGRLTLAQSSGIDITERKLAEEKLRSSEERLRLAQEAGRMGSWEWDIATGEVVWSPALEQMHGLEPGTFARTFEAFQRDIHPDDRAAVLARIQRTLDEGLDHEVEYRIVRPDGRIRWVEGRGKLFRGEAGEPRRLVGVCCDVTERRQREQSLRFLAEASKSLSSVVDYKSTLQAVARLAVHDFADWCTVDMLDDDGVAQRIAAAHADAGKVALLDELHRLAPSLSAALTGAAEVLRRGSSELREIDDPARRCAAGEPDAPRLLAALRPAASLCVPMTANDRVLGVITFVWAGAGRRYGEEDRALAEDLGRRAAIAIENARLYEKLQEADRRKDEFLATLAHELRNPLAPIRAGLEVLAHVKDDPAAVDRTRSVMERQARQLVTLVDDLMDVSRITRGKMELRKRRIALDEVVRHALDAAQPLIEEAGHELSVSLPDDVPALEADPHRLAQVLANLLANAAKYTPRGGKISLEVARRGEHVRLGVADTGVGIPAEMQERIFEMFAQLGDPAGRGHAGLGIGLTLVKSLVAMHGGRVEVRSEGPGRGSEFAVWLPLAGPVPAPPASARDGEPLPAQAARRVLVVDDNDDAAQMLAMLVELMGHEVRTAGDGGEALQTAAEQRPDVVLMDLGMPKMNGYDAARALRRQPWGRDVLLVALSGWGQDEDKRRTREAGFDLHLVKPVGQDELARLLDRAAPARRGEPA